MRVIIFITLIASIAFANQPQGLKSTDVVGDQAPPVGPHAEELESTLQPEALTAPVIAPHIQNEDDGVSSRTRSKSRKSQKMRSRNSIPIDLQEQDSSDLEFDFR